jgi:hypothetical protein
MALLIFMCSLTATWYLGDRCARQESEEAFTFKVSWFCIFGSFCQQGKYGIPIYSVLSSLTPDAYRLATWDEFCKLFYTI